MTILNDAEIDALCLAGSQRQLLTPFVPRKVVEGGNPSYGLSSAGYDIRLSENTGWDCKEFDAHYDGYSGRYYNPLGNRVHKALDNGGKGLIVYPHSYFLAVSLERFIMPDDILAEVKDKSTWARRFLTVANTVIEPGWEGYLTLEITNSSDDKIYVPFGCGIAQVLFHQLRSKSRTPYGNGKYQDQPAVPVGAK